MKIVRNENIVLRDIHAVYFLINIKEKYWESKSLIQINEIGKNIWNILGQTDDIEQLLNSILKLYDIPKDEVNFVKDDIQLFLENLKEIGYIRYE